MPKSRAVGGKVEMSSPAWTMRPWVWMSSPAMQRNQRRLAATRRAQKTDEFAVVDVEAHVVERGKCAEHLREMLEIQVRPAIVGRRVYRFLGHRAPAMPPSNQNRRPGRPVGLTKRPGRSPTRERYTLRRRA